MPLDSSIMEATALFQIGIVPVLMNGQERGVNMGLQVGPFQCPASEAHNVARETSLYRRSSWTWKGLVRCHQSYYS